MDRHTVYTTDNVCSIVVVSPVSSGLRPNGNMCHFFHKTSDARDRLARREGGGYIDQDKHTVRPEEEEEEEVSGRIVLVVSERLPAAFNPLAFDFISFFKKEKYNVERAIQEFLVWFFLKASFLFSFSFSCHSGVIYTAGVVTQRDPSGGRMK